MGIKQHLQQAGGAGKASTLVAGGTHHHDGGDKRASGTAATRADMAVRLGDGENVRSAGGNVLSRDQLPGTSISYQQLLMGGDVESGSGAATMVNADGGKSFHWKKSKLI